MSRSKYVSPTVAVIDYYVEEMMLVVSNGTDNPTMNVYNEFNDEIKNSEQFSAKKNWENLSGL